MDDVIDRVREYAKNLANNGAPHQTGVGRDILKVVELVDVTSAKLALVDPALISAASGAKALQDELNGVRSQLTVALGENKRLAQAVADAAAENAKLRAEIEHIGTLPVNKFNGMMAQRALPDDAPDPNDPNTHNAPGYLSGMSPAETTGDGAALTSASHEQFGTSIDEVVGKMQDGGIMGQNGEVTKPPRRKSKH